MLATTAHAQTPLIRKYLQAIRKLWQHNDEQTPFFFTHSLTENTSIELFCVQFVMKKYMN